MSENPRIVMNPDNNNNIDNSALAITYILSIQIIGKETFDKSFLKVLSHVIN